MTSGKRPSAWRHLGFRQLTRAWFFTNIADAALFLMLAVWVKDLTGSDRAAAMVFVALGIPALIAPLLGQLADRMSRKTLLSRAYFGMIPVLATLVLVEVVSLIWLVYAVTFLYGAVGYLTASAQSGLVRDLLPDEDLASGNGVLSTVDMGLRLVSPLLGTGLYVFVGPMAVIGATAASFAVSAYLLTKVTVTETPPVRGVDGEYWGEVTAGFRHLVGTPGLGRLTVVLAIGFGAAGLVNAAVFPAMEQGFGVEAATLGILVSLQGIGAVVGGATSARLIGRVGEWRTVAVGMGLLAAGLFPLAGTSLVAGVIGLILIGLGVPWILVAYTTLRQRLTPPLLQGRAAAASNMAISLPQTVATSGAAALLGVIDYRVIVVFTVAVVAVNAVVIRTPTADTRL